MSRLNDGAAEVETEAVAEEQTAADHGANGHSRESHLEGALQADDGDVARPDGDEAQAPSAAEAEREVDSDADAEESDGAADTKVDPWEQARVEAALEAMLFASPDVLAFRSIRAILPEAEVPTRLLRDALEKLEARYEHPASGIALARVAGGYQFQTRESEFPWVQSLAKVRVDDKVTPAALETLAIIAYKQPITRAEIDAIRGVGSGQIIRTLMDKKMAKVVGRVDLPGRPFLYGTTPRFLEHFGLGSLEDLPANRDF